MYLAISEVTVSSVLLREKIRISKQVYVENTQGSRVQIFLGFLRGTFIPLVVKTLFGVVLEFAGPVEDPVCNSIYFVGPINVGSISLCYLYQSWVYG